MLRRIVQLSLSGLLLVVVTACVPLVVASANPTDAAVPAPADPTTTGKLLSGVVTYAGQPVPNARVELREPGWIISQAPALVAVQADEQGAFSIANPPLGDFSVVGIFPDGEVDSGGWPAVVIEPGQEITDVVVPLERALILVSPTSGEVVDASPTLVWQAADGATQYSLWVVHAGTTELMVNQVVPDSTVTITRTLEAATYTWVVNALNAAGDIRTWPSQPHATSGRKWARPARPPCFHGPVAARTTSITAA